MDPDKRTLVRHFGAAAVGLGGVFLVFLFFAFVAPGVPFFPWICLFAGYVVYRLFLKLTTPPKFCSKCNAMIPPGAASCPDCGKILIQGL